MKICLISHNSPYIRNGILYLNGCNLRCWPPPVNLSLIHVKIGFLAKKKRAKKINYFYQSFKDVMYFL